MLRIFFPVGYKITIQIICNRFIFVTMMQESDSKDDDLR